MVSSVRLCQCILTNGLLVALLLPTASGGLLPLVNKGKGNCLANRICRAMRKSVTMESIHGGNEDRRTTNVGTFCRNALLCLLSSKKVPT